MKWKEKRFASPKEDGWVSKTMMHRLLLSQRRSSIWLSEENLFNCVKFLTSNQDGRRTLCFNCLCIFRSWIFCLLRATGWHPTWVVKISTSRLFDNERKLKLFSFYRWSRQTYCNFILCKGQESFYSCSRFRIRMRLQLTSESKKSKFSAWYILFWRLVKECLIVFFLFKTDDVVFISSSSSNCFEVELRLHFMIMLQRKLSSASFGSRSHWRKMRNKAVHFPIKTTTISSARFGFCVQQQRINETRFHQEFMDCVLIKISGERFRRWFTMC